MHRHVALGPWDPWEHWAMGAIGPIMAMGSMGAMGPMKTFNKPRRGGEDFKDCYTRGTHAQTCSFS